MDDIYQEYAQMVFKFLFSLSHNQNIAEELTQETFYQAIKSAKNYDGSCKISTWLCQIAKHLWYQEMAKTKRKKLYSINDNLLSDLTNPEDDFCLRTEKIQLMKAVHILDETAKEVFLLRIYGTFSFKDIGEVFAKNENWARVTFYRAKQKIIKEMTE